MQVEQSLKDKIAIVTGSGRGMGAANALKLASHGAHVVINYNSSVKAAEGVAQEAREKYGVRAIAIKADVSNKADLQRLFEETKRVFGRIDIVMSNSGIEHFATLQETTEDQIDKVFAVNVKGQYFIAQLCDKYLEDNGRLILISSISAVWGRKRHAIYSASKGAVMGMLKCLAYDLGGRGITVNAIAPGGIKTDMWKEHAKNYLPSGASMSNDEIDTVIAGTSPLGRVGYPDDVAGVVALLASPEAKWITGQTIHVSGGAYMA